MSDWLFIGIGLLLTVGTGIFVGSEFSLVNLDRRDLESRQEKGEQGLGPTIAALKITSTHLSSAQLGITLTTLLAGYCFEPAFSAQLRGPLGSIGVPGGLAPGLGTVLGVTLATLLSMVIGELVPKNFALALPLATAKVVVPAQAAFTAVFKPLVLFCNNTANRIIRSFGIEPKEELSGARSAEELSALVRHSALAGVLDRDQATLLNRTLHFSGRTANEVMTPRVYLTTVASETVVSEIVALSKETGHSRFPVRGTNIDNLIGVVHVKDAFAVPIDQWESVTAASLLTPVAHVPEMIDVAALLVELRSDGFQIVIVVDEYGGTAGIVTLEDLLEELVGELVDEHDYEETEIIRSDQSVVFSSTLRPDELYERTGIRIPEDDDYETVGGFMVVTLNRVPELGDEVQITSGTLIVEQVDGTRLDQIRYVSADPENDPVFGTRHDRIVEQIHREAVHG